MQENPYRGVRLWAEIFADMQAARIAIENKIQALYDIKKKDFNKLRKQLKKDGMAVEHMAMLEQAEDAEAYASKVLQATLKNTIGPNLLALIEETPGLALHTMGRLLGATGDPYIAYPHHWEPGKTKKAKKVLVADDPFVRRVSDLWGYSGYGDAAKRPYKGMTQEATFELGNPDAKKLGHLVAGGLVQSGVVKLDWCDDDEGYDVEGRKAVSKFGEVYLNARRLYAGSLHPAVCVRCGPKGKPAQEGSVRSPGHQHAMATRKVVKELLKDVWIAARADHELES